MKEGRVVYECTFQLQSRIFSVNPDMTAQLPKSRTDQYELLFGNSQSLWQYLPDASSEGDQGTFAGGMILRFAGGSNDVSYFNFNKGVSMSQREIADKDYVVTDSVRKLDWKLMIKQKPF
jgi:GLPGLI family protein